MVGRGRLLVVNITVGDSGSATWVHHCIRTSAMTRCVFRRIIFFHELGRPSFSFASFISFFSLFFAFFFFFWNTTAYFAQFAIRGYAPGSVPLPAASGSANQTCVAPVGAVRSIRGRTAIANIAMANGSPWVVPSRE